MQKPYLKLSAATATVPAPPPPSPYAQHQVSPRTIRRMATQSDTPLCLSLSLLCSAQPAAAVARLNSLNSKPNPPYAMLISGTSFWLRTAPATQLQLGWDPPLDLCVCVCVCVGSVPLLRVCVQLFMC